MFKPGSTSECSAKWRHARRGSGCTVQGFLATATSSAGPIISAHGFERQTTTNYLSALPLSTRLTKFLRHPLALSMTNPSSDSEVTGGPDAQVSGDSAATTSIAPASVTACAAAAAGQEPAAAAAAATISQRIPAWISSKLVPRGDRQLQPRKEQLFAMLSRERGVRSMLELGEPPPAPPSVHADQPAACDCTLLDVWASACARP